MLLPDAAASCRVEPCYLYADHKYIRLQLLVITKYRNVSDSPHLAVTMDSRLCHDLAEQFIT